jgi:hypothetical protein
METRSLTMENSEVSPIFSRLFFLIGKIALVIFFTMAIGWGYGYAMLGDHLFLEIVHRIMILAASAIVSGLLARFIIMRPHGWVLAWLTAFLAMMISLVDLNRMSFGRLGFQIFNVSSTEFNSNAVIQLIAGGLIINIALNAWNRRPREAAELRTEPVEISEPVEVRIDPAPIKQPVAQSRRTRTRSAEARPSVSQVTIFQRVGNNISAIFSAPAPRPAPAQRPRGGSNSRRNSVASAPLPLVNFHRATTTALPKSSPTSVRPGRRQHKAAHSSIRLMGKEEHHCPYCLCVVSPRDPAGVVICPVCKTYHHKSCWDVTGACQVGHENPL